MSRSNHKANLKIKKNRKGKCFTISPSRLNVFDGGGRNIKSAEIVAATHATSDHGAETRFWSGPCLTGACSQSVQSTELFIYVLPTCWRDTQKCPEANSLESAQLPPQPGARMAGMKSHHLPMPQPTAPQLPAAQGE